MILNIKKIFTIIYFCSEFTANLLKGMFMGIITNI